MAACYCDVHLPVEGKQGLGIFDQVFFFISKLCGKSSI
jgi:hypothetical protein